MKQSTVIALQGAIAYARDKFPGNEHLNTALMEEVGELANTLLEGSPDFRTEALHVAVVALRIFEEGDADYPESVAEAQAVAAEEIVSELLNCPHGGTVHPNECAVCIDNNCEVRP